MRIPPLLVAALTALSMWLLSRILPQLTVAPLPIAVVILVALCGVAFELTGVITFRRQKTTVNPLKPENASTLVTSGVYRISRNPMYVGMLLLLIALDLFLASFAALVGPLCFVVYMNRFQIGAEEQVLLDRFGDAYADYKNRVRRWL